MAVSTSSVAGIVAGRNPLEYSASSPYTIFLFQAVFIIFLCYIVNIPLRYLQQPRVIGEVISGILLGPTVMGRIPGFTENCFPKASVPGLTLMANVGIILFLFIIGLEVDLTFIKKHWKAAISVGLINMAIPFGLGCAISVGIYNHYVHTGIEFTTYMVFIAVALCITAFPVLARILTELNLIGDRVGTIVLAAGITNDLLGWILLALVVTLANSLSGINTLYILLITFGWFLFLCYPVKFAMRYSLNRFTSDLQTGCALQILMMLIISCVFISAFFTDIIGVHPIFGAFMVGVIVPRDNGYVINITEKLEDLVHIVLIPIYFALAGLNTNLGLLNEGIDWAYTIGIIGLAMVGKVFGGFILAKANKLLWRESLAVGVLMSCKGIVEIVVLTVGLNAGIISQKVYSMFIVMALITTFLTTPLALLVYPVLYREKRDKFLKGEINWDNTPVVKHNQTLKNRTITNKIESLENLDSFRISKLIVLVKRIDSVSTLMHFIHDFAFSKDKSNNYPIDVKALHLRDFNSRTSHLLEVSAQNDANDVSDESGNSSILGILKIFTEMMKIHFSSASVLAPIKNHIFAINEQVSEVSDLLIGSTQMKLLVSPDHVIDKSGESRILENTFSVDDNSDFSLYKKLFHSSKSHFGLLLTNDKSSWPSSVGLSDESSDDEKIVVQESSHSLFGRKTINLLLNNDGFLSSSDLLALHIAYKLGYHSSQINVFVNSTANSSRGFDSEIEALMSSNTSIDLEIHHIKDPYSYIDQVVRNRPNIAEELLVIPNSLGKGDENKLFVQHVNHCLDVCLIEGIDLLVVKAAHEA